MRSSHEAVGMKTGYAAIVAIVALLAAVAVPVCADDSDALASLDTPDSFEFDNMSGGTLKFVVNNTRGGSFEMDVSVLEDGKEVASEKGIQIPASQKTEVSVDMSDFTSVGTHTLTVKCTPENQFENPKLSQFTITVEVKENLLSNWMTYVVILIVVIVIAVFAYLKIRDSPKKKTEMTFEQLEEQRKAEMATKTEKKKVKEAAPTTERQRYLADKKKKKE